MGVSGGIMSDKKSSANGGIGFGGLLTIVFITLKLCKVINWSWVWVLSPIWISAGIFLVIVLFTILVVILKN
jgi:hypothetical protein